MTNFLRPHRGYAGLPIRVAVACAALVFGTLPALGQPTLAPSVASQAPPESPVASQTPTETRIATQAQPDSPALREPAPGATRRRPTLNEALADAQQWVLAADARSDYSTPLFSYYLYERFGWRVGALQLFRAAQGIAREMDATDWGPLIGAPHPAQLRTTSDAPSYAWVPAAALRCHMEQPPRDLSDEIASMLSASGYEVTHGALAWAWARELGCPTTISQSAVQTALTGVANGCHASHDLCIEALAMMAYVGGTVSEADVQRLLAAQRPDGSWGMPGNFYHATTLAAWTLLVHRGAVVRDVPMTFLVPGTPDSR